MIVSVRWLEEAKMTTAKRRSAEKKVPAKSNT
jgi:hypothetical protein